MTILNNQSVFKLINSQELIKVGILKDLILAHSSVSKYNTVNLSNPKTVEVLQENDTWKSGTLSISIVIDFTPS